jgi:hypothetical protein
MFDWLLALGSVVRQPLMAGSGAKVSHHVARTHKRGRGRGRGPI